MLSLPLLPQGVQVSGVLAATKHGRPLYPTVGVLMPRRASKTTAVWATLLGRCRARPGYKIVTTAQDGLRARNRFREVLRALEAGDFTGDKGGQRIGRVLWGAGSEAIEFDNGSRIWVVKPEAGALRGEAADVMLFDEAGELSEQHSEDLVAGALPLMDTRPGGQVIIAGTPGTARTGLLWTTMEQGRRREGGVGIVDYSIRDSESAVIFPDDGGDAVLNEAVLRRVHPGVGTLTTMRVMRDRFSKMALSKFEREYLCRFPITDLTTALDLARWADSEIETFGLRPERVAVAFDVAPDSSAAALCAAWRDDDGRAHVELLGYQAGTAWLPARAEAAARKHRTSIAHDTIGANTDPADVMHRRRIGLAPLNLRAMQGAAGRFSSELDEDRLRHYGQDDLTRAVEGAAWRTVGEGGRLFARMKSAHEVCPLVAASAALWHYDTAVARRQPAKIHTTGGPR